MASASKDMYGNGYCKVETGLHNGFKYSVENDNVSQELQYKMSKKIAQLTKVIFALNSKNDDHEALVIDLENRHKKELEGVTQKVKQKLEKLESQMRNYRDENTKFEVEYKKIKNEYNEFKKNADMKLQHKDKEYIDRLTEVNKELSSMRFAYEDLLTNFNGLEKDFKTEKQSTLEEIKEKYMVELENLKQIITDKEVYIHEIEENYKQEIARLTQELKDKDTELRDFILNNQNKVEVESTKLKMELEQLKISKEELIKHYEKRIIDLCEEREMKINETMLEEKKLLEFQLEEQIIKYQEMENGFLKKEKLLKKDLEDIVQTLKEKENTILQFKSEISDLNKQKKEAIENVKELSIKFEKERITRQNVEINYDKMTKEFTKIEKLLTETQMKLNSSMKQNKENKSENDKSQEKILSLMTELKELKRQMQIANEEKSLLSNSSKSFEVDYEIQKQQLEKGLQEFQQENSELRAKIDRLLFEHKLELQHKEEMLKREGEHELEKMAKKIEKQMKSKENSHQEQMTKEKEVHNIKLDEERQKASRLADRLKNEIEQLKSDLNSKIKSAENEASESEMSIRKKDMEIKSLNNDIKKLKEKLSNFKKDNKEILEKLNEKEEKILKLNKELENSRKETEQQKLVTEKVRKSFKVQEDMAEKYNQLSADLDKKWADTMRKETGRIRNELMENFELEKTKMQQDWQKQSKKDRDELCGKLDSEKKSIVSDLESTKQRLEESERNWKLEKEKLKGDWNKLLQETKDELTNQGEIYKKEKDDLISRHQKEIQKFQTQFAEEKSKLLNETRGSFENARVAWEKQYEEGLQRTLKENEKTMTQKLNEMENNYNKITSEKVHEQVEKVNKEKVELEQRYKEELKVLKNKLELMEKDNRLQTSQHRSEVGQIITDNDRLNKNYKCLEEKLSQMEEEKKSLNSQISDLNDDLIRYHRDLEEKVREKEVELKSYYEQVLKNTKSQYEEKAKQTLTDFTQAQNIFKEKIKELTKKLEETEENYINRPSRDEDVEIISTLRAQLRTSEKEVERLIEEKKYIQLELVNRETNYNKIFNSSVNMAGKTRKLSMDKVKTTNNASGGGGQKLVPLPGSPFHDESINPNKPLPQSSRKSIDNAS